MNNLVPYRRMASSLPLAAVARSVSSRPSARIALLRALCRRAAPNAVSVPSKILGHPVSYCVFLPPELRRGQARTISRSLFPARPRRKRADLLNSGGWNLIEDLWEQKQIGEFLIVTPSAGPQLLHQFARRPRALRGFLHPRIYSLTSKATTASRRSAATAASPAYPWAATARCDSLSAIRSFSARSARTAPR